MTKKIIILFIFGVLLLAGNMGPVYAAVSWGQWLGGSDSDNVYCIVVNGNEIYLSGASRSPSSWESISFYGAHTCGDWEGYVLEIIDNGAGSAPTLSWGHWFGGSDEDNVMYAVAVNGNEIYVAGKTLTKDDWESVPWQGAYSGLHEGFIIEILDNDVTNVPTINWGQWLGGTSYDLCLGLAVNGNEIYVVGQSRSKNSWENANWKGAFTGGNVNEAFIVEILDNDVTNIPTFNWGQWLGGSDHDGLSCVVVKDNEIYVAGSSYGATSWESVSFSGTHSGGWEGFVIEMLDNDVTNTPTLNWGQWLGGSDSDGISDMFVVGNEIHVAGRSYSASNWEISFQGSYSGSPEIFVAEILDNDATNTPTLTWGQWFGGSNYEYAGGVATIGNTVYVTGVTLSPSGWEGAAFEGAYTRSYESFVLEISDNDATNIPTLSLVRWLGGYSSDWGRDLAIGNDSVYVVGESRDADDWEPITFYGSLASRDVFLINMPVTPQEQEERESIFFGTNY